MRSACVFAHFDPEDRLDDYVLYYVKSLLIIVDTLFFVSVSRLNENDINTLSALGAQVIQRKNIGYDFFSYKKGIELLNLDDYDELFLCNDSVYGPFNNLSALGDKMRKRGADFWGVTESNECARHLQSYFLCFGKEVLQSRVFQSFWTELEALDDKSEIIQRFEVGLSQKLLKNGFRLDALVPVKQKSALQRLRGGWRRPLRTYSKRWLQLSFYTEVMNILSGSRQVADNPTHMEWEASIVEHGSPFVKIELLRDNPKGLVGLGSVYSVIASVSEYPLGLISTHLARVSSDSAKP